MSMWIIILLAGMLCLLPCLCDILTVYLTLFISLLSGYLVIYHQYLFQFFIVGWMLIFFDIKWGDVF